MTAAHWCLNSHCLNVHSISIDADFNVSPNITEPTEWRRLGNLKTDGADAIIRAYRDETPAPMHANRTIPVSQLARRYGDPHSKKLYPEGDLISRFMHQWGVDVILEQAGSLSVLNWVNEQSA